METCCDLEIDVNGEETFMVDKRIIAPFSGRFGKLFSKLDSKTRKLKVIFHDFPGGAEGFEVIIRFCYNGGKIQITAQNIFLLSSAASFMEMGCDSSGEPNMMDQIEKSLEEINYWTWSELMAALKQCQDLHSTADSSSFIIEKVLSCLIGRLGLLSDASPSASFSDNSKFQFSSDFRSCVSTKCRYSQRTWWFDDLLFLDVDLIDNVIKMMVSQNLDHDIISKFLFYYRRSRFLGASPAEKCQILETVISLLALLTRRSSSFSGLFDIFRLALRLKTSKHYRNKLESLIGSQLDEATVDHLLIPSPSGKDYAYDVSLVLRLVKAFLFESSNWLFMSRLNKVSSLIDAYLAEVSPDPYLKPSKFSALLRVLPDSTRQSHDGLYRAIAMYLEVHAGLCKEDKIRVCSALNYGKLSIDALKHLAQNSKFPSKIPVKSSINQQAKLVSSVLNRHHFITTIPLGAKELNMGEKGSAKHILLRAKKHNISTETEKFGANLQGMNWKTKELEKFWRLMQTEMGNITKTRLSASSSAKIYVPKLCS